MQSGPGKSNNSSSTDTGYTALSLHQPWASLLVHGIKRIEGRAWPCDHRGQLWIHSTSQRPTPEDIQAILPASECNAHQKLTAA